MINGYINHILKEIHDILEKVNKHQVNKLTNAIIKSKTIVVIGSGRMGYIGRMFAMRLGHLELCAYSYGDSTVPSLNRDDLLIVCSGSGETQTIYDMVLRAKNLNVNIALISSSTDSRMAKLANIVVVIPAPSKISVNGYDSKQPLTSLNEQCIFIFLEALFLQLVKRRKLTNKQLWRNHSILE